jgi:hypothetical protein
MNVLCLNTLNICLQLLCNFGQEQTLNTPCHRISLWHLRSLFEKEIFTNKHNRHSHKEQGWNRMRRFRIFFYVIWTRLRNQNFRKLHKISWLVKLLLHSEGVYAMGLIKWLINKKLIYIFYCSPFPLFPLWCNSLAVTSRNSLQPTPDAIIKFSYSHQFQSHSL